MDHLVPVAVIGTSRRDLDPDSLPPQLDPATALAAPPAEAVLILAARAAVADRISLPVGPPGTPADAGPPQEERSAPSSSHYAGSLAMAVGGRRWAAVVETLRDLDAAGLRLPLGAHQALLDVAITRPDVRQALGPVLGSRGRWLAHRNPRWAFEEWLTPDPADQSVWKHGSPTARVAWLRAVRGVDPARARDLLIAGAAAVDAATRASWLTTLEIGLGPADEAVLEEALDDRAHGVREVARRLLPHLHGSAFVARMRRRLADRVDLHQGRRWDVQLADLDDEAARDGIRVVTTERPPGALAVRNLDAGVPLSTWESDFGVAAKDLVAVRFGQLQLGPLPGLRDAAIREGDEAVARALLQGREWPADPELVGVLPSVGPPVDRQAHQGSGRDRGGRPALDRLLAHRVGLLGPMESLAELTVHGFEADTARVLLAWVADSRSFGHRARVLASLGDYGPLGPTPDLAAALRDLAGRLTGSDRSRAFDAAMTVNLRRSLRAEVRAGPAAPEGDYRSTPAELSQRPDLDEER